MTTEKGYIVKNPINNRKDVKKITLKITLKFKSKEL